MRTLLMLAATAAGGWWGWQAALRLASQPAVDLSQASSVPPLAGLWAFPLVFLGALIGMLVGGVLTRG